MEIDGRPHISTSFSRKGCIPTRMLKWNHYADAILRSFAKGFDDQDDLATDQAILQHYGWRSFFVDATANPAVASWFAGHNFQSTPVTNLAEDCWEQPAFLVHENAWYTPSDATGVVYVISKKALRSRDLQAVDLMEIMTVGGRPPFAVQNAWMLGPLDAVLPPECIVAKVLAPASIFRDYASRFQLRTDRDLFPEPKDDPVLKALLSVPWVHRATNASKFDLEFYDRGLPIPEYRWEPVKRYPSNIAFYRSFWIANEFGPHAPFSVATYFLTPEPALYGTVDIGEMRFPLLTRMLRRYRSIIVEVDGLMGHPQSCASKYGKGLYVSLKQEGRVCVSELMVDHPGMRPQDYGIAPGFSYRVTPENAWERHFHANDCTCGNDSLHNHHLVVAAHVEAFLKARAYRKDTCGRLCAR